MHKFTQDQVILMQKTANTLVDLAEHSDVGFSKEIAYLLAKQIGQGWPRLSTEDFSAFPVARFATTHSFLEMMANRFGGQLQIIELGAGFTSHFLNLKTEIGLYVEVDFQDNSRLKQDIMKQLKSDARLKFVGGDVLEKKTWDVIIGLVDLEKPTIIFSEGVVSQYFTDEQKQKFSLLVAPFLKAEGSCLVMDDTLRNHPEFHAHPIIQAGMNKIVQNSGSKTYGNTHHGFEEEMNNWRSFFANSHIYTLDYVLSKPNMDFVLGNFKLIICMNDKSNLVEPYLQELSNRNKLIRVWKE